MNSTQTFLRQMIQSLEMGGAASIMHVMTELSEGGITVRLSADREDGWSVHMDDAYSVGWVTAATAVEAMTAAITEYADGLGVTL